MRYTLEIRDGVFEAMISERITYSDLDKFRQMIAQMIESQTEQTVMDLSDVEFIDSAGLGMLLLIRDKVIKHDRHLLLKYPQGQVKRMFAVARFDKMFDIIEGGEFTDYQVAGSPLQVGL